MGVNRLFWPQELLDEWLLEEQAVIDGGVLSLAREQRRYGVQQAVLFTADVGDGADAHGLVGRVKDTAALEKMHAEHYMDSVLIGDSAYKVVPGFTGEPLIDVSGAAKSGDITGAVTTRADAAGAAAEDRELLAQFLLDNL
ncbi:MAG TPA: hypothetical protein VM285_06095 [Polyangia bacterium]|nr:hypothetical protein [Polyangia bacterium]